MGTSDRKNVSIEVDGDPDKVAETSWAKGVKGANKCVECMVLNGSAILHSEGIGYGASSESNREIDPAVKILVP